MSENATDRYASQHGSPWNPRSRPIISCLNCRRKKQKCDRHLPCNNCLKTGRPSSCQYAPGQEPTSADGDESLQSNKRRRVEPVDGQENDVLVTGAQFNELQTRVKHLEKEFDAQSRQIRDLISTIARNAGSSRNVEQIQLQGVSREERNKLVVLQPLRCQFPDLQNFINALGRRDPPPGISTIASNLQDLSRFFEQPMPTGAPSKVYDKMDDVLVHIERILPPGDICKTLIDVYFQAFEGPLRVLHPIAKTSFQALFHGQLNIRERNICLPTLLAVVSIVSTLGTLVDCEYPKVHGQDDGIGAFQLLRNYLELLTEEEWTLLPNIQICVLSLKQHRSSCLSALQIWRQSGEMVRRAMTAGIHRPLSNGSTVFEAQMKRRLWLTILEMDLTFAIASKMPVTCPMWDGDVPLNIEDEMLYPLMQRLPPGLPPQEWTSGICQHILAQSFNERRAAYNLVAADTLAPYDTVLQHTRRLQQIIHDLPPVFRLTPTSDHGADSPYRLIVKMEMDFLLRRPLNACYAAHGAEMAANDEFREARIPWIQGCSFSMCFQDLFDPKYPMLDLPSAAGLWDFYYNTYRWDVDRFMLANFLELQRLRSSDRSTIDMAGQPFNDHALHGPVKIMGWTIDSITISLEETIDPLIRRLGRHGADFGKVVRWVTVMGALRVNPTSSRYHSMQSELEGLVSILRMQQDLAKSSSSSSSSFGEKAALEASSKSIEWLKMILSGDEDIFGSITSD